MSQEYTHDSIKVLEEVSHIRQAKGMYIGECNNPNQLLYEVLDNALDEAVSGNASLIGIEIDSRKHIINVADNGRGIPFQNDTIKVVATKLFSGGKFDKGEGKVYGTVAGLHGVGLVAVTALSDYIEIQVYRDNKHANYRFEDAKSVRESIVDHTGNKPYSTQVTFKPSKQFFDTLSIDLEKLRDRLKVASIHIPNLQLLLFVDNNKEVFNCKIDTFFASDILGQAHNLEMFTKILDLSQTIKDEYVKIKFCWDLSNKGARTKACVNLLNVDQGTHINSFYDVLRNVIFEEAEKEKIKIEKQDALVGLRCYVSAMLYTPEFSSQTKEKLSSSKTKLEHLFNPIETQFRALLKADDSFRLQILNHFANYRKKLNTSNTIIKTTSSGVSRYNSVIGSNLRDCSSHDVKNSELFITEGASASGSIIQTRDTKHHAILSLKGKIPNIADDKKEFFKNKEIIDIVNALGTGAEPDFDITGMRYGKIIIATDADADGGHIFCLLMTAFLKLTPKLIEAGFIYKSEMPLYGSMVGKVFHPFYTEEEMKAFQDAHPSNVKMQRYKGLGEMNPSQLKVCLLDTPTRRLTQITLSKDAYAIFDLMTSAELKRRLV